MIGTRLGRYQIVGRLGAGGMGEVYEAEDTSLDRTVALKLLPAAVAGDPARHARLEREARASAAIAHPNIVVVHAVEEADGRLFLVMERVRGVTLAERLPPEGFAVDEVLRHAIPLASAIGAAHARGLVHRDLKPHNVMVTDSGQIKVLDFGIAQWSEARTADAGLAATVTAEGAIVGTVAYMSPEQVRGHRVDATSDVYALGVVLFELATGRRPFEGATAIALAMAILNDPPPPPRSIKPGLPAGFERLVLRCLDKDPARRPPDGAALERELRALAAGPGATVEADLGAAAAMASRPRASRWRRRAAMAAAVGALGVAAAAMAWTSRSKTGGPATARSGPAGGAAIDAAAEQPVVTVTDLPPPRSPSHEALAAYAAGMQAWRDGSIDRAADFFEQARELDPGLGAAYLRIALRSPRPRGERAAFFKEAVDRRASLQPHEALLLDAFAPCIQGRSDDDRWCVRRIADAAARFPRDAELAFWAAKALLDAGRFREALAGFDRALALDPAFGLAWVVRIHTLEYLGEFEEAERAIVRCIAVSPSDRCLHQRAKIVAPLGRCAELETVARSMLGVDPGNRAAMFALTAALDSQGRAPSLVASAASQAAEAMPVSMRAAQRLGTAQLLARARGDFTTALAVLAERERAVAASREQGDHADVVDARIQLEWEVGHVGKAGAAARAYLERRGLLLSAGTEDDIRMRAESPGLPLLAELRAGLITKVELRAERDRFVADWRARLGPGYLPYLWLDAYATSVDDADDAREALAALPSFGGLPRFFAYAPLQDQIGRTFLLAGRLDEAIEWLDRAARACELPYSTRPITARLMLGQALELKGDTAGACAAYRAVLDRWGKARPRSVTADEARRRVRKLGCR